MKDEDKNTLKAVAVMAAIMAVCLHFESVKTASEIIIMSVVFTLIAVNIYNHTRKQRLEFEAAERDWQLRKRQTKSSEDKQQKEQAREETEGYQAAVNETLNTYFNHGYEVFENTKEKYPNTEHEEGWYWMAFNTPREGFWFIGAFETKQEAHDDALKKAIPIDDARRENEIFDGVLPDAEVKYAWGNRGVIDTPLQGDSAEILAKINKAQS